MDRLGLEFICTLGLPPVAQIALAAELGITKTGLAPAPITANPHGFAAWDLRRDAGLVRATGAALRDHGVSLSIGEGFLIMPGLEIADSAATLDIMAELGAPLVNCVCIEQDRARAVAQFASFAAMAAERGLVATLEFMPLMWPATLDEALALIAESGAANGRLLLDAMHVFRSGATVADLARLDPALIGYVQLCDVPMPAEGSDYGEEARHERRCPGEGDLPLAGFLRALPSATVVGLEVPMVSKARAGLNLRDALAPCVAAAHALLG
jgi:sugar phosphate isomerase/epimerase